MYGSHPKNVPKPATVSLDEVKSVAFLACECIEQAYNLTRLPAKEVLVVMLSDVDRIQRSDAPHAVPLAYGLSGYSLKVENIRVMLHKIIEVCAHEQLHVPVVSFDGQLIKIALRDSNGRPLTILQLQKDVWKSTKAMKKCDQIAVILTRNHIDHVENISQLSEVAEIDVRVAEDNTKISSPIYVGGVIDKTKRALKKPLNLDKWLSKQKVAQKVAHDNVQTEDEVEDYILPYLPADVLDGLDEGILCKVKELNREFYEAIHNKDKNTDEQFSPQEEAMEDAALLQNPSTSEDHIGYESNKVSTLDDPSDPEGNTIEIESVTVVVFLLDPPVCSFCMHLRILLVYLCMTS